MRLQIFGPDLFYEYTHTHRAHNEKRQQLCAQYKLFCLCLLCEMNFITSAVGLSAGESERKHWRVSVYVFSFFFFCVSLI